MGTSFDTVIDLALVTVDDYKLGKLIKLSEYEFNTYVDGFLIAAIGDFDRNIRPITYDAEARTFSIELSQEEIEILSDLWVIQWFDREIRNSAYLQNKLQISSAFTTHSPAQSLKEKSSYVDRLREKVQQKMTQQQLSSANFYSTLTRFGDW